ncbi:MAG: FtsQ-type POTRA domain-containing protein [Candidatus Fermentibacteraceae bacterium]|nr:FtsQ-type POTRA domain-containing protein [Candidatus Fermentibacteraceae bacterium]
MRERRMKVFWVLLISGICAFALSMGYRWFERGGAFDLDTVRIRGIRRADSSVVCQAVQPLFGRSIWQLDLEQLQQILSEIPGIDSARVRRVPLRTLVLELDVSQPSFAISDSTGKAAVSTLGEILPDRFLSDSLPVVDVQVPIGSQVLQRLALWFGEEGTESDGLLFSYTQRGVSVLVDQRCSVLLGSEDLTGRWAGYKVLSSSMGGCGDFREVDMRYSGQAVLRMAQAGAAGEVMR